MTEIKDNEIENEEGKKKSRKSFFWIKFPKDFFHTKKIRMLKARKNGHAAIVRYLELLVETTDTKGVLQLDGYFNTDEEEIAFTIDESEHLDELTEELKLFEKMGLIEFDEDDEGRTRLILNDLVTMVGQGESTPRVQRHREKKKQEEKRKAEEKKLTEDDATERELEERMDAYNKKRDSIKKSDY